jgi:hypothetical protein
MNTISKIEYNDITVSVITTNNKVVEHDTNSPSQIRLSEKFTILIEGSPEETGVMVKKLQDFMQSSLYYPMLIRDFFSDIIPEYKDIIEVVEIDEEIHGVYVDIVKSLKTFFKTDRNCKKTLDILSTVFPPIENDYDFAGIFAIEKNKKNTTYLLSNVWTQIQEMQYQIFEIFYDTFSKLFKSFSASDFKSGYNENYLNLEIGNETVKIGYYSGHFETIMKKSFDIVYDFKDYIKDNKFPDLEYQITEYKKYTYSPDNDNDPDFYSDVSGNYSDVSILYEIFPFIIKKIRYIVSGVATKDVEEKEIDNLKSWVRELYNSDILNHELKICMDQILYDDLLEGMLDNFLNNAKCNLVQDWTNYQYAKYTEENFDSTFRPHKNKYGLIQHYSLNPTFCKNGKKWGDCTDATGNVKKCPFLHTNGFRLSCNKYFVLSSDLENEEEGKYFSEEIASKIFETVRMNHPEHRKIYQIIDYKKYKNTLLLPEKNEIKNYTHVYEIPSIESEVVNSPSKVICNDSSRNDSLENSFNELSIEDDVNSTSETQQDVNSTSETQQVGNSTTSVMQTSFNTSFYDDESEDEDNTCESEQIVNVWNTGRLTTIVEKDEDEYVQDQIQDEVPDKVPDENQSIVSEIPSKLESVEDTDTVGSSSSTKDRSVPYVFFEETKVFFNQPSQRLISDGSLVEVLEYVGNNMVRCRAGKNRIICDPFEEFVNFRRFAELCNKKYVERKKKIQPQKEKVKKNYNLGKIVTKDKSFLSVVSNSIGKSTSSGVSSSSVVLSDKENAKDIPPKKNVNSIPVEKSLSNLVRPNLNPCSHYLSKGVCRYNEKCRFDHVTFCKQFYTHGVCNDNCGNYHPEELKKLVEKDMNVSRILDQSGDFYGYWKKLYIPEICRAKYVNDCKYKNCRRFHYKSTK